MSETFALCLFIAALPLEQFSAIGVTALKLAGALALVAWLFSRLRATDRVCWDAGLTLMVLFTVWGTASCLWSMDPAASIARLPTYVLLLVSYFLLVNVVWSESRLTAVMVAMWFGTLVLLASGVADMTGVTRGGEARRISGILGNPNGYATMLVACIPSGYWFVARTRALLRRTIAAVALAAAGITSIYTQSRGGIISIAVFFLALLGFRQTRWRAAILATLAVFLVLRAAPLAFWERWDETMTQRGNIRTRELWPAGFTAIAQRPLLGSGLGTNGAALYAVRGTAAHGGVVHSAPLAVAMELGLPGLVLYLGFIAYPLVRLMRTLVALVRQGRSSEVGFTVVLLASFVAYLTNWFKGGGMEYAKMLWVLLGLMTAYARILEGTPGTAEEEDSVSREPNPA